MENERRLPPTDLHSLGYNIPYNIRFNCYNCGENNESKVDISSAELKAYKMYPNRLMTVTCRKCKKDLQFTGIDLLSSSGYFV